MRKTFQFGKGDDKPCLAAGIIFYKNIPNCEGSVLMIKTIKKNVTGIEYCFEDFGGKTELTDNSIKFTACREAEEESNGIFKKEMLLKKLKYATYFSYSKYVLYFININSIDFDPEQQFGDKENHTGIERYVEWITITDLNKVRLHPRIHKKLLTRRINEIFKV